jgi:hypothetical protein
MATQKAKKTKTNGLQDNNSEQIAAGEVTTNSELKIFLQSLLDRMGEGQVAPVFALSAINHLLSKQEIFTLFCPETKELARDIWLRIKQSGLQVRNPVFLFAAEAEASA